MLIKGLGWWRCGARFNRRHKKGKLNFEFKPWNAPIGSSEISSKILNHMFEEYFRNEEGHIIHWNRVVDGFFEVGETIALYESFWKRIAPLSKINYSLENEKLYRQRTNREYRQLF